MTNRPQRNTNPPNPSLDDIDWLNHSLFDTSEAVIRQSTASASTDLAWTALPMRGPTRRLVPTSRRFAATALANEHDAMSPLRRVAGRMVQLPARVGALRLVPQMSANRDLVLAKPDTSVIAAAAAGIGVPVASCAITLGPRRYNRKPVIQLIGEDAVTVGFLKVGADKATSAMVDTEASALAGLGPTTHSLEVPRVLWRSSWRGRTVACLSPVGLDRGGLVPAPQRRLIQTASAVINASGGRSDELVRDAGPVERLRALATEYQRSDELDLLDRIEKTVGNQIATTATWHGDFSPWNMISDATTTALIDWEFSLDRMPVGADLLHHRLMVATHLQAQDVELPIQQLLAFGNNVPDLHAMQVPAAQHRIHVLLYLLELIRRDVELAQAGLALTGFGSAAFTAALNLLSMLRAND